METDGHWCPLLAGGTSPTFPDWWACVWASPEWQKALALCPLGAVIHIIHSSVRSFTHSDVYHLCAQNGSCPRGTSI